MEYTVLLHSLIFQGYKSPGSVLVDVSGKFLAYGHDAEATYAESKENGDDKGMLLFASLDVLLHKGKVSFISNHIPIIVMPRFL